jgi:hypothetical protein
MARIGRGLIISAVALAAVGSVRQASAQQGSAELREVVYRPGEFRVANDAGSALRSLWDASIAAKEERVACIGGRRINGVAYITKVQVLDAAADSAHVSAVSSLTECRPPEWFGTVHTHIAKFNGLPFVTFSADDRNVISIWRSRWKADGVFCILYTNADAYCEAGTEFGGDTAYIETRAVVTAARSGGMK